MIHAISKIFSRPALMYEVRQYPRVSLVEACTVERWGRKFLATTRNISRGGICLDIVGMGSTILDADLTIHLKGFTPIPASARWSHKRTFGIEFDASVSDNLDLLTFIDDLEMHSGSH